MDIDLDSFFGGQAATDLDDVASSTTKPAEEVRDEFTTQAHNEESIEDLGNPNFKHYNYFRERVPHRSDTPATVSLFAQLAWSRKVTHDPMSRIGVIMSQANKYVDPVVYTGPTELLKLEGTEFKERVTGYVTKVRDSDGWFGPIDGETTIMDVNEINEDFCADDESSYNAQRPYFVNKDRDVGELVINAPGYRPPKYSQWKRDENGKIVRWDGINVAKPIYRPSRLSQITNAINQEDLFDESDEPTSSSDNGIDVETPPSSPEPPSPLSPIFNPIDTKISISPSTDITLSESATAAPKSRSQYAGVYAACIIGLSVVLSLW
ncbi:MAG: hypothetical protein Q9178_001850 [Gyalolechia marmorata]